MTDPDDLPPELFDRLITQMGRLLDVMASNDEKAKRRWAEASDDMSGGVEAHIERMECLMVPPHPPHRGKGVLTKEKAELDAVVIAKCQQLLLTRRSTRRSTRRNRRAFINKVALQVTSAEWASADLERRQALAKGHDKKPNLHPQKKVFHERIKDKLYKLYGIERRAPLKPRPKKNDPPKVEKLAE